MLEISRVGSEFLVNTQTAGFQIEPAITGLSNGGFVVSWAGAGSSGDYDIKAQLYSADGAKVGSEFLVNLQTQHSQVEPAITGLANGGFVVSWEDFSDDGSYSGVKAQVYDAMGGMVGSEIFVHTQSSVDQFQAAISGLAAGGFVVTWADGSGIVGDASLWGVNAQIFNEWGEAVGSEFLVNTQTAGEQLQPTIAVLSNGGFVVSWTDYSGIGGDEFAGGIKAQIFSASGNKVGSEFLVNTQTASDQSSPTIAGLENGGFVVAWQDSSNIGGDASGTGIKAQIYDASGTRQGSEFLVNSQTLDPQYRPRITGLANGGFVVSWTDLSIGDGSGYSIKAQVYSSSGTRVGSEFLVNTHTVGLRFLPDITSLANGTFVVSWMDDSGDANGYNVRAQIFQLTDSTGVYPARAPDNASPVTNPDTYAAAPAGLSVDAQHGLLANDTDAEHDPLIVTGADLLSGKGQLSWNADGSFTFTPANNFRGDAVIRYTTTDGKVHVADENTTISKVGSEFLVNSQTGGDQTAPIITSLTNGGFVITWQDASGTSGDSSGFSIKAQIFKANGEKLGEEFLVDSQTAADQIVPCVTGLANGGFVITWQDWSDTLGDSVGASIKAQIYNAAGTRIGSEFLVNSITSSSQYQPTITGLANGGFVATWHDYSGTMGDASGTSVKAQIFSSDGAKVGSEFRVNSQTIGDQLVPAITGLTNGGFVISWWDTGGTLGDPDWSVKVQVYDASGSKIGSEQLVNTQTAGEEFNQRVTGLSNGGFVVTWNDLSGTLGDATGYSIKAQIFDASGVKLGSEFLVNTQTASHQVVPTITNLANGGFVVSWYDYSGTLGDASATSIKAQVFSADGNRIGTEFLVNSNTSGDQWNPTITGLANGDFVISWQDASGTLGDASGTSVKAQIYHVTDNSVGLATVTVDDKPPVTVADSYRTGAGPLTVDAAHGFLANDSDPEGDPLAVTGAELVSGEGQLSWNSDGSFTFTPSAGHKGDAVIRYTVSDGEIHEANQDTVISKVGSEFLVNTQTLNTQEFPTITGLSDGGFVISWEDFSGIGGDTSANGIKAQIYSATGAKVGSEFLVNTQTQDAQSRPTTTGLANGGFVVSWMDHSGIGGDAAGWGIKAQIYSQAGAKVGSEFLVNTETSKNQLTPVITGLKNGNFVVTWQKEDDVLQVSGQYGYYEPAYLGVKAQVFSSSGEKVGTQFDVLNARSTYKASNSKIIGLQDGNFIATWAESNASLDADSGRDVKAQIFSATGAKIGSEFLVDTQLQYDQDLPVVTDLINGGFVISWQDWSPVGVDVSASNIKAQIYSATGARIGSEFLVNTQNASARPTITSLANGGFVISWTDASGIGGNTDSFCIKAQVFSNLGAKIGSEFRVNTQTLNIQDNPTITGLANGDFVVSWEDRSGYDGSSSGIKAQIYHVTDNSVGYATVTAGNTPPTITGLAATLTHGLEDHAYVVSAADLLQGISDADGDSLSVTGLSATHGSVTVNDDGTFTITPDVNYNGTETLSYSVIDGNGGSIAASQSFILDAVNDEPALTSAKAVLAHGTEDEGYTVSAADLLQGFSDVDGDSLSVSGLTATHGSVSVNDDGTFTITPDANYNGTVALSYSVIDGNGGSVAASQSFILDPVNDSPVVAGESYDAQATVLLVLDRDHGLLANDTDVDTAVITVKSASVAASQGNLTWNADGSFSFTAAAGFEGDATIGYVVTDGMSDVNGVAIIHVNAKPTNLTISNASIQENAPTGTLVGVFQTSDPDDVSGFTYSLIEDNTHAFIIDGSSLKVRAGAVLDFETTPTLDIKVRVKDPAGHSLDKVLTVTLQDVNPLINGTSGNDKLLGTTEHDRVYGGAGNDTIYGYDLDDDLYGEAGNDIIYGGTGNDRIYGDVGADRLYGDAGNDTIYGGADNDTLDGGTGADAMYGGAGNDAYFVDNPGDSVTEYASDGTDIVNASVSFTLGGNIENLTLIGTGNIDGSGNDLANLIKGNAGSNTLSGGAGADKIYGYAGDDTIYGGADNDIIDGGLGADAMFGGTGNDSFIVGDLGDTVTEYAGEGTDIVKSSVAFTLGANIENLTLTGTANINGTGNGLSNTIAGNAGNNLLSGGDGADRLNGGDGNDILNGGKGNDTLTGGTGNDVFVLTFDGSLDTLTDFAPTLGDTIQFDHASFGIAAGASISDYVKLAATAPDSAHGYLLVTSNSIFWDADGSGAAAAVKIAALQAKPSGISQMSFTFG